MLMATPATTRNMHLNYTNITMARRALVSEEVRLGLKLQRF